MRYLLEDGLLEDEHGAQRRAGAGAAVSARTKPGRPVPVPPLDPAAILAARRESERRRQASLREGATREGGGSISLTLRAADAAALAKICRREGCTRSAAVRAALLAYAANTRKRLAL